MITKILLFIHGSFTNVTQSGYYTTKPLWYDPILLYGNFDLIKKAKTVAIKERKVSMVIVQ